MQTDFSKKATDIIHNAMQKSNSNDLSMAGSEYLILAMYDAKDSLCHFILDEYEVKREEIEEVTNELYIIRKNTALTNKVLDTILHQAKLLAGQKAVEEEHIFMAILMNPTCIAAHVLVNLGLEIDDLIIDVNEIYEFNETEELDFTKNITSMAKKNELTPFIGRKDLLDRLNLIIHRKTKSNPLLIGNAGVGKTALVEGYASQLVAQNSNMEIISLNLTSMLAGTKYRGDFEQRFDEFSKKVISKKNVILFIDEIHTIMGAGTTEGNLDIANMLKPYLARSEVKIIGATTLEEYHKTMEHDKALCRRFQPVYVLEPSLEETREIVHGVSDSYFQYHGVTIENEVLDFLIEESNRRIPLRNRPDKCLDILDDVLAFAKIHQKVVGIEDVTNTISRFIGCTTPNHLYEFHYPHLQKYSFLLEANLLFSKTLLKIKYIGNKSGLPDVIDDCIHVFRASPEMVLELDFQEFSDSHMTSSLIGAPPGYVGYEEEGILTKHLMKYQIPLVVIHNFESASAKARNIVRHLMEKGEIYDAMGTLIKCSNAIFIIQMKPETGGLGFGDKEKRNERLFDEVIVNQDVKILDYTSSYKKQLQAYNIELSNELVITEENKKEIDEKIFSFIKQKKQDETFILE